MTAHINISFDSLEPNQALAFAAMFTALAGPAVGAPHVNVCEKDATRRPSVYAAACVPAADDPTTAQVVLVDANSAPEDAPTNCGLHVPPEIIAESNDVPPAAEAPKKRGRNPKEKTAKQTTLDEAIQQAEAVAEPAATPVSSNEVPTLDQLRDALNSYIAAHGTPAAVNLLADFGAERVSEVAKQPIDQQLEFLKLCKK